MTPPTTTTTTILTSPSPSPSPSSSASAPQHPLLQPPLIPPPIPTQFQRPKPFLHSFPSLFRKPEPPLLNYPMKRSPLRCEINLSNEEEEDEQVPPPSEKPQLQPSIQLQLQSPPPEKNSLLPPLPPSVPPQLQAQQPPIPHPKKDYIHIPLADYTLLTTTSIQLQAKVNRLEEQNRLLQSELASLKRRRVDDDDSGSEGCEVVGEEVEKRVAKNKEREKEAQDLLSSFLF
ncbi:hypothetical protein HDU79_009288 [Rhizoclosmatium sp. JEL0117]|nr:hypothetical protein HDU79_009288 [Rhizoclosmatium sp. JEL0117]